MPQFEKVNPSTNTNTSTKSEEIVSPTATELQDKTNLQITEELAALELEQRKQEVEYRKQEMEFRKQEMEWRKGDMILQKDAITQLNTKRDAALEQGRAKILATMQFLAQRAGQQQICNHRKGGRGPESVMRGAGDDAMYCVIKHKLPSNKIMVLCQRCGKEWHPANPLNMEGGKIVPLAATKGWEDAVQYPTDNSPSASSSFLLERTVA